MKQKIKFKQSEMKELTEDQKREFDDRLKNFEYLKQERVSRYQGLYISLFVVAILLLVDIISGQNILFKFISVIVLLTASEVLYRKSLIQTQKSSIICENMTATIEGKGKPIDVKSKNGKEWTIFKVSDIKYDKK